MAPTEYGSPSTRGTMRRLRLPDALTQTTLVSDGLSAPSSQKATSGSLVFPRYLSSRLCHALRLRSDIHCRGLPPSEGGLTLTTNTRPPQSAKQEGSNFFQPFRSSFTQPQRSLSTLRALVTSGYARLGPECLPNSLSRVSHPVGITTEFQ
jgi:hypothetical protein